MDLKDKLNLLWKYLLLIVIVFAVGMMGRHHRDKDYSHNGHKAMAHGGMYDMDGCPMGMGQGMDIKVEKQINNGDTTLVVWVNGEEIDNPHEFMKNKMGGFDSDSHAGMKLKGGHGKMVKKIIRIEVDDDDDDD